VFWPRPLPLTEMGSKKAKKHKKERTKAAAHRPAVMSGRAFPNRRTRFAKVTAVHDVPAGEEAFAGVVESIRLERGDVLMFQSPHIPPFYLLTAKAFRDRAEPKRLEALTKTKRKKDGKLRPLDPVGAFDALEGLTIAVMLSAAAIEAHANDMIRRLPGDATVEVQRKNIRVVYEHDSMERSLNLVEKITLVGPMLTGRESIKGTKAWEAYWRVVLLRNELLHVKSKAGNGSDQLGPFGLLMRGDGSCAPEDAAVAIHGVEPDWIPRRVRLELGIP